MLLKIFPFFPHLIFPFFIFTFFTSSTLFISFFSQIWNKQALSLILIFLISSFHGLPFSFPMVFFHSSFFLLYCFFFHFPLKHLGLPFIYGSPLFFFHFLPKDRFLPSFLEATCLFFFAPILPITTLAPWASPKKWKKCFLRCLSISHISISLLWHHDAVLILENSSFCFFLCSFLFSCPYFFANICFLLYL